MSNIEKDYLDYENLKDYARSIIDELKKDDFIPDLILAPLRGGLFLAQEILYFDEEEGKKIKFFSPNIKSYNGTKMGDIDFNNFSEMTKAIKDLKTNSKILITEDIVDSGNTTIYLLECLSKIRIDMDVRISTLVIKDTDKAEYYGKKFKEDSWIVFPWDK